MLRPTGRLFVEAKRDIHILHRRAGRALAKIVQPRGQPDPAVIHAGENEQFHMVLTGKRRIQHRCRHLGIAGLRHAHANKGLSANPVVDILNVRRGHALANCVA